jgi:hypothetical protein
MFSVPTSSMWVRDLMLQYQLLVCETLEVGTET